MVRPDGCARHPRQVRKHLLTIVEIVHEARDVAEPADRLGRARRQRPRVLALVGEDDAAERRDALVREEAERRGVGEPGERDLDTADRANEALTMNGLVRRGAHRHREGNIVASAACGGQQLHIRRRLELQMHGRVEQHGLMSRLEAVGRDRWDRRRWNDVMVLPVMAGCQRQGPGSLEARFPHSRIVKAQLSAREHRVAVLRCSSALQFTLHSCSPVSSSNSEKLVGARV